MGEEMNESNCEEELRKEEDIEDEWEKDHLISEQSKDELESMWEIPQIFHFLQLTKKALNISHLSMYEVERMLLMPKASRQLANIMTSLLSSPNLRTKLHKLPPMPYEFWTNVLMHKVQNWFKIYQNKHKNIIKVFESIGVESQFWNFFPDISYIEGKDFENLTFKQRVWLLKTLCDTILHNRKTIQDEVLKHSWENRIETILGVDRHGARYIYFPHFLESDLRVYRHCLDNGILSNVKPPIIKEEPNWDVKDETKRKLKFSSLKTGRSKRRKSRWRNGSLPNNGKRKKRREKKQIEKLNLSYDPNMLQDLLKEENKSLSDVNSPEKNNQLTIDSLENISSISRNFQSHSEEELNNMTIIYNILDELISTIDENLTNTGENNVDLMKCNQSTTDNEINNGEDVTNFLESSFTEPTSETEEANDKVSNEEFTSEMSKFTEEEKIPEKDLENDEVGLDKWLNALSKKKDNQDDKESEDNDNLALKERKDKESKNQYEDNDDQINAESDYESSLIEMRDTMLNEASFDEFPHAINTSEQKVYHNVKFTETESWDVAANDFKELITDLSSSNFKLIADSVETLRNFVERFSCNDNSLSEINKSVDTFIPVCEINLLSKLSDLLKSVESFETALNDCTKQARSKLHREWTNLKDGIQDDKESSTEDRSNWWVIGSQNCMLSSCGSLTEHSDCEFGKRSEKQKYKSNDEGNKQRDQDESDEDDDGSEEKKEKSKRVLRARGISSYNEHLFSDNSDTEELERWTEFEATYTSPNAQINSSTLLPHSLLDKPDKRTDPEDSDQDWILPSSRRKRRKRQSASRRLKTFQNKLQNIKASSISPTRSTTSEIPDEKSNIPLLNEPESKEEKDEPQASKPQETSSIVKDSKSPLKESLIKVVPPAKMTCKIECADSVHSELDIKDEGPIIDNPPNYNVNMPQTPGYVIVKTEPQSTGNYYVMQPNPPMPGVVQQPYMQQPYISNPPPQVHSTHPSYYIQGAANYVLHNNYGQPRHPMGLQQLQQPHLQPQQHQRLQQPQQMMMQQPQMMGGRQVITHPNYSPYIIGNQPNIITPNLPRARLPNMNNQRPTYVNSHGPRGQINHSVRMSLQNRMNLPRQNLQNFSHPNGAVIRSMPLAGNGIRNPGIRIANPRNSAPRLRAAAPRLQRLQKPTIVNSAKTSTSLIVLSDSDDDIEMIINEKSDAKSTPSVSSPRKNIQTSPRRKPVVTSEVRVANSKSTLPPQIMQRMSQGGISITPVKANPPPNPPNPNTQLVVVVNETGSHYALALPNGSKLILTPEQVAQIRASNGGKLIL